MMMMTSLCHESRDRLSTTAVWSYSPLMATAVCRECSSHVTGDELHIVIAGSRWYKFCFVAS